jgi:hypothetical protein
MDTKTHKEGNNMATTAITTISTETVQPVVPNVDKTINRKGEFNYNQFKHRIKDFYKNIQVTKTPKIYRAHIPLTIINQYVLKRIIRITSFMERDIVHLLNIDFYGMYQGIGNDEEIRDVFILWRSRYDANIIYSKVYSVSKDSLEKYISNKIDNRIKITQNGFNFLVYLLEKTTMELIRIANTIREVNKGGTINDKQIIGAMYILFGETRFTREVESKIIDELYQASKKDTKEVDEVKVEEPKQEVAKQDQEEEDEEEDEEDTNE